MDAVADTTLGRIEGLDKDGVLLFAGVPFAAPPIGPRRFRPPEPHEPWSGTRDATQFGAMAIQGPSAQGSLLGPTEVGGSEDCLTLNVQTPSLDGSRPVLVWIHGGGFTTGAIPWYNGAGFVQGGDIVVVTINYRLGVFGFLHLADHDPDFAGSGLAGSLDQVAALEWVRDNISHFGGDPSRVTIFGESAGGMSVATLMGMPAAHGLFNRAIAQSGAAHNVVDPHAGRDFTDRLLVHLGIDSVPDLMGLEPTRLLEAQTEVVKVLQVEHLRDPLRTDPLGLLVAPVVDGERLPRPPLEAVADGSASDVAFMTGTTQDEYRLFALATRKGSDETKLRERVGRFFEDPDEAIAVYRDARPDATPDDLWSAVMTDRIFRIPALRLAEAQATHRPDDTYLYLFSWASPAFDGQLASCHALEIPFVFDNLHQPGVDLFSGGEAPQALADVMHAAWTGFARDGDPSTDTLPWEPYMVPRRPTMRFDTVSRTVDDPGAAERRLWDGPI
jgi:para-nitrobenzyl esterase